MSITTNLTNLTPTDAKQLESSFDKEVFDISDNIDEQAVQPSISLFPRRMIYNKYRSFNSSWIKTYLRSTMISERLHNSEILSIERELSGQLVQDPTSVIDEFATSKNRRLSFSLKLYHTLKIFI
ncbi:hypothetical protein QTP88_008903 [Uroleucon formosanum]